MEISKPDFLNQIHSFGSQESLKVDRRSRQEIRDDYTQKLAEISKDEIRQAINFLNSSDFSDFNAEEHDKEIDFINDCLVKLERYKDDFESLNSEHSRRINLKREELKLDADADLSEKWRTFRFRILGSGLLIITLFLLGTLNHHITWLHLPFERIFSTQLPIATNLISSPQMVQTPSIMPTPSTAEKQNEQTNLKAEDDK